MTVTDAANAAWLADPAALTPESAAVKTIAAVTAADPAQISEILQGFTFLPAAEQAKPEWLGAAVPASVKETAAFLKGAGRIDAVADD